MKNYLKVYQELLQGPEASVFQALEVLDKTNALILVVDRNRRLLGTVADSDVRKVLIKRKSLEVQLKNVMNKNPAYVHNNNVIEGIVGLLKNKKHQWIPILDESGYVESLCNVRDVLDQEKVQVGSVVIMAGGLGVRLHPMTLKKPKPMMLIGDKPILELIIRNMIEAGFKKFFISVSYLSNVIKDYFGNGEKWGIRIEYIEEAKPMGTAGALSLLRTFPDEPILVINGDLLTRLRFDLLMDFHYIEEPLATVCVCEYSVNIPYGIVKMDGAMLKAIEEKPSEKFFINAGIYVLEPKVLKLLNTNEYCDMPELMERINKKYPSSITCFPMKEHWIDIGRPDDYKKAIEAYG